jgi:hypothetical protein
MLPEETHPMSQITPPLATLPATPKSPSLTTSPPPSPVSEERRSLSPSIAPLSPLSPDLSQSESVALRSLSPPPERPPTPDSMQSQVVDENSAEDEFDKPTWHGRSTNFKQRFFYPCEKPKLFGKRQYPVCKTEGCNIQIASNPSSFPRQRQEYHHVVLHHWDELMDEEHQFVVTAEEAIKYLRKVWQKKNMTQEEFPFLWEEASVPSSSPSSLSSSSSSSLSLKRKRLETVSIFYRWRTEENHGFGILAADRLAQVLTSMGFNVVFDQTFIEEGVELLSAANHMINESDIIFLLFFPKCLDHSMVKTMIKGLSEDEEDYFQHELRLAFQSSKRIIPILLDLSIQEMKNEVQCIEEAIPKYTVDKLYALLKRKVILLKSTEMSTLQDLKI